jgi:hypothetical protein
MAKEDDAPLRRKQIIQRYRSENLHTSELKHQLRKKILNAYVRTNYWHYTPCSRTSYVNVRHGYLFLVSRSSTSSK